MNSTLKLGLYSWARYRFAASISVIPSRANSLTSLCQEQIDLSGFVANELSAFSVLEWRAI